MNELIIPFKKLRPTAISPKRATAGAAGYDLYVPSDSFVALPGGKEIQDGLLSHSNVLVRIGWAAAIPKGYVGLICPRSGLSLKEGITVGNGPGVVDSDYRGEIGVILHNTGRNPFAIRGGDRIAQLVIVPVMEMQIKVVNDLDSTHRDENGFGSTGK